MALCHAGLPKQFNQANGSLSFSQKTELLSSFTEFPHSFLASSSLKNLELQHKKPCDRQSRYLGLFIDKNSNYNKWLVQGRKDGEKQNEY